MRKGKGTKYGGFILYDTCWHNYRQIVPYVEKLLAIRARIFFPFDAAAPCYISRGDIISTSRCISSVKQRHPVLHSNVDAAAI